MVQLRKELHFYFLDHKFKLADGLENDLWVSKLIYMVNIFSKFNEIYLSLQKNETNIFRTQDNMPSFSRKLQYVSSQVDYHNFNYLITLTKYQL